MYDTEHRCFWNKRGRANWSNFPCFANYRLQICICHTSSNRPWQSKALFLTLANTFITYTTRIFARRSQRSTTWNDLSIPSFEVGERAMLYCLFVFLLSQNRYYQFHSSIIRIHFACIITLNKQEMNFRWRFLCRRRCGMFSAHWELCPSTVPRPCPQMIYISYWMAVKREISPTLSLHSSYADHLVEKVILSSLYHRRTVES